MILLRQQRWSNIFTIQAGYLTGYSTCCIASAGLLGIMTKRVLDKGKFSHWHIFEIWHMSASTAGPPSPYIPQRYRASLSFMGNDLILLQKGEFQVWILTAETIRRWPFAATMQCPLKAGHFTTQRKGSVIIRLFKARKCPDFHFFSGG